MTRASGARRVAGVGPRYPVGRSPKIAVPIRTSVAPQAMATAKSALIPIDRCGSGEAAVAR